VSEASEELQRRLASNEAVFRDVNEGIERGQWPGDEHKRVGFRCECARLGCNLLVQLTLADYERVRAHPRHFVMIPGHELPEVETVVERADEYVIVEKRDEAGRRADEADPRS
jgi:hypothetical protein